MKATRKPVILVIENAVDITGSLNSVLRSSIYLRDRYEFIFILPDGSRASNYVRREGFDVTEFPMIEIRKDAITLVKYIPRLFFNARKLSALIQNNHVDVILNNDFYNLLPAIYRFLGGRTPYLCYVRFLPSRFPASLVRLWYNTHRKMADWLIAVSHAVRRELPSTEKVVIIGNELPLVSRPFTQATSRLILYPSNFMVGKGHEAALRAFALVAPDAPDWKIRFIGSDMGLEKNLAYKGSLIQLGNVLGIDHQIEWLEFDDQVNEHYLQASVVLNFSESESFSMTTLEAMFFGRTVIATKCGGPEEIITDEVSGLLVPVNNIDLMAKAIRRAVMDEQLRNRLSSSAYDDVRAKYSAANTIEKLAGLYERSFLN